MTAAVGAAALAAVLAVGADTTAAKTAPVPGQRQNVSAQAYTHYLQGRIREIGGDLRGALEEYRLAAVYDAFSPYLHLVISDVQARLLNFKAAIVQAEAAVELDPSYVDGYLQLGLLFRILGEFEPAERAFQRAIAASPRRIEGYVELSRVLLREKKEKEAESVFEMMMVSLPDSPVGYFEMGRIYFEKRMLAKAARYLTKALEKDPSHAQAAFTLAAINEIEGRFAEAAKVLEALQHFVSDDPDLMLMLGRLALKAGDRAGAERYFGHLRRFAWSEIDTRIRIAMTYLDEAWFDQAVAEMDDLRKSFPDKDTVTFYAARVREGVRRYRQALDLYRSLPASGEFAHDALVHGGYCLVKLGEYDKAIAELVPYAENTDNPDSLVFHVLSIAWGEGPKKQEGIAFLSKMQKLHADWLEVTEALAAVQEKADEIAAARRTLEEPLSKPNLRREDRERVLMGLAMLYERAGDGENSLTAAQKVLDLNPDSPEALNFVGYTWAEQGKNLGDAEEMVKRALLYKPDSGYVTDSLGWVYYQQGRFDKALETLRRADRLAPEEPEILGHIAETLLKLGRTPEAIAHYRRALDAKLERRVKERFERRLKEIGEAR